MDKNNNNETNNIENTIENQNNKKELENDNINKNDNSKKYMIKKSKISKKIIIAFIVAAIILLIVFEILDTQTNTAVLECNITNEEGASLGNTLDNNTNLLDENSILNEDVDPSGDEITINEDTFYAQVYSIYMNYEEYLGTKVNLTGFIYKEDNVSSISRIYKCNDEDCDEEYPVGFVYEYNGDKDFQNDTWVKASGILQKRKDVEGEYPVLVITDIEQTNEGNREIHN